MLTFVLLSNLLICLVNFFLIFCFSHFRKKLALLADYLTTIEEDYYSQMSLSSLVIDRYKNKLVRINQGYEELNYRIKKAREIIRFLRLIYRYLYSPKFG
jgi:hypothetical protein